MKVLLTGGCSFSVVGHKCWPYHLQSYLNFEKNIHTGTSCQGNDLISKKILYQLFKILEKNNSSDVLVGIMWSGPNRKAVYLDDKNQNLPKLDDCPDNPTAVCDNLNNWYILNGKDRDINDSGLTSTYYKMFYSLVESYVNTCENILRVQWFLQKAKIKYFMATYTKMVLPDEIRNMPEVDYLYNQIDFNNFLPVEGEYEWCKEFYGSHFLKNDNHPTPYQHENFTQQVIVPFLQSKKYV